MQIFLINLLSVVYIMHKTIALLHVVSNFRFYMASCTLHGEIMFYSVV